MSSEITLEQLNALVAIWQKRLRLQDWDVVVKLVRSHEIPGDFARISWTLFNQMATIRFCHPGDITEQLHYHDHEQTLVHELIHLFLAPFAKTEADTLENHKLEVACDHISRALVAAYRREETVNEKETIAD